MSLIKYFYSILLVLLINNPLLVKTVNSSESLLIVELTDANFDSIIGEANSGITWILEFYADW